MEAKVYSEMSNPEIIQTLQREGDNQQYYEGQEERSEQEQEGRPLEPLTFYFRSTRGAQVALGVPADRGRAALTKRRPQRDADRRITRDIRSKSLNAQRVNLHQGHYFAGKEEGFAYLNDTHVLDVNSSRWIVKPHP